MRCGLCFCAFLFLLLLAIATWVAPAGAGVLPTGVLVLYNTDSDDGLEIAQYYAQVHPGVQLLGLTGVSTDEQISADEYLAPGGLRDQVIAGLTPDVDVIVTTKGLPLRIDVAPHTNPGSYTDPFGVQRTIFSSTWKRFSSLEAELTLVDTVSTWEQMGDQTWWIPEASPQYPNHSRNLYYDADGPFDHQTYGTRLTTRLDGFSVDDVTDAIDRAQNAFVGPDNTPLGPFHFVVDDDPSAQGGFPVDLMERLRDNVLLPRGLPHQYDGTDQAIVDAPGPVLGYVSHGTNDGNGGLDAGYINSQLDFELADGAVFQTWESYNAITFDSSENYDHGLVAEWIKRGGTAGLGHVQEPLAGVSSVTNEDKLYQMLLDGFTFAEAAWSATQQLSFVNTMVGDPLMVWRQLTPGDANMDGMTGFVDLQTLSNNWGEVEDASWQTGDFNGDGLVGFLDLQILSNQWGETADWYAGSTNNLRAFDFEAVLADLSVTVPEPSSIILMILGLIALACRPIRARASSRP